MNPERIILVIDDEKQSNKLNGIKRSLNSQFTINYNQVFVIQEKYYKDKNELKDYDVKALAKDIEDHLKSTPDIVLIDYDYGDEIGINGLNVVDIVRKYRKNVPIILYSADQKRVIKDILGSDWKNKGEEDIVNEINKLLSHRIHKMCPRDDYSGEVINFLKNRKDETPQSLLRHLLRENGDRMFNSCCPKFKGKTFNELADILEGSDGSSYELMRAMLEQTVAYLTIVNE